MRRATSILQTVQELRQPRQFDLQRKVALKGQYRMLSQDEGRELGRLAISLLDSEQKVDIESAEDLLVSVACLVPGGLDGLHQSLVKRECFYPGVLYLGADAQSRDEILQRIAWDYANLDHLLKALAWIGDAAVQQQFHQWRDSPPEWRESLYVPPEEYAQEAGWVLTAEGTRRDLFSRECYTLVRLPEEDSAPSDNPLTMIEEYQEKCRWCDWQMTTLFSINLASPQLAFLNMDGKRLRVVMCDRCSGFTIIYMDVDLDGHSVWAEENVRPEFIGWKRDDYPRLPVNRMTLGPKRRTPYEAHWQVLEKGHSQIGGHPAWVQHTEYPECPGCNRLMAFIAQLQTYDLEDFGEGTTYAFCCAPCGKATTVYQQT